MLRAMGLTPSYLDLRPLTSQAKETVSFQEFLDTYVMYTKAPDTHEALVAQLKSFDHQGDGTLDSDELMSALTTIGMRDAARGGSAKRFFVTRPCAQVIP